MKQVDKHRKIILSVKSVTNNLINLTVVILVIVSISLWVRVGFWLEIVATYSPQILFFSVAMLLVVFALFIHVGILEDGHYLKNRMKKYWWAILIVALAFGNIIYVSYAQPAKANINPELNTNLNLMTFNKLYSNKDYPQIINHINLQDPDILVFQEIFKAEAEFLSKELGYENWHIASCGCSAYGSDLAIFSKFPIAETKMLFEDRLGGVLRAEIELALDTTVVVYNVHIIPPYKQKFYDLRGEMFEKITDYANAELNPVIVMGDFNASQFSLDLRNFTKQSNNLYMLTDGHWAKCSWYGFSELFCARIDHIFLPKEFTPTYQTIGPNIGSDHRAVSTGVAF